ncbi:MAG: quinolinate synthase NadA, partial [Candidatus Subteraquimicrobiales bacterium]|nr:quinolinate synthase NadA [Candidatus Subteraquimicrobiales bacterium]
EEHPDAKFMAHPECRLEILVLADEVCSTSGMLKYAKESSAKKFIVGTESGIVYRLRKEIPDKLFIAFERAICPDMKRITLEKVLQSLRTLTPAVIVPENVRLKAKRAVTRMLGLSC